MSFISNPTFAGVFSQDEPPAQVGTAVQPGPGFYRESPRDLFETDR